MNTFNTPRTLACTAVLLVISWSAAGVATADDRHDAWSHDHNGYWDNQHQRHAFVMHDHHRGFWRQRDNGTRIFINID